MSESREEYERRRAAKCYGVQYRKQVKEMLAPKPSDRKEDWTQKGPSMDPRFGGGS